jgi:septum formation protein
MLVLASASSRRAELLRNAAIDFVVQPAHVPEIRRENESPLDFACRVATEKARAVAATHPHDAILAADTIVVVDHHVLGKPRDPDDAFAMLRLLSGRWHQVITGVCLITADSEKSEDTPMERVVHETTRVYFNAITDDDILAYIATGEPMDKAGAYAIQGQASRWISRIEGCYFNVVGLPVAQVYRMLRKLGLA